MNRNGSTKEWVLLNVAFAFMLCVFAPLEAYYSNKNEFWFSIWKVVGAALIGFVVVEAILTIIFLFLHNTLISKYYYSFLTFLMVYLYIQGNYIPRNYGVLKGVDINWNQYTTYRIASVILALVCLILSGIVLLKFGNLVFKCGSYLSLFIFLIQIVTLCTFAIRDVTNVSDDDETRIVTDNKLFELSENNNIIVFILDTFDGEYLNYLLETDYDTYSGILKDFTYYRDTLGAYPVTKLSLPFILTGVWYENEKPYTDYIKQAYDNNAIYDKFQENDYSVGIYTYGEFLSSDIQKYENVEFGSYRISSISNFMNTLYKMVAFNYAPHQLKKYFFYSTGEFELLKKTNGEYSAYLPDVQKFVYKLKKEGITKFEKRNCFRMYHLDGVHAPRTFGKDLTSDINTTYTAYDEAAGNCTLLQEYFNKLKDEEIYDETTIVIMADHGDTGYSQNPIFLIKNKDERHEFVVSDVAMSFEYLSSIWSALIDGKIVDEAFINNCRRQKGNRRFLYYSGNNDWHRGYMTTISEAFAVGTADDVKNILFSGTQYEPEMQEYPYSLGVELSYADNATAKAYCVSGFSGTEAFGAWTNGTEAVMAFNIKEEQYNNLLLTIESGIYGARQEVLIYANNHQVADVNFYELEKKEIIIPNKYVENGAIRIRMKFPDAVVPHDIDESSDDRRQLALSMRSIKLESTDRDFNLSEQIDTSEKTVGVYKLGTVLSFSCTDNTAKEFCLDGFSGAEDGFTWTNSKTADLSFLISVEESRDLVLEYKCIPFNKKQQVILYANNQQIAAYYHASEETKKITIPADCIKDGKLHLRFELPDAKSPKDLGMSEDDRILGLAMKELTLRVLEDRETSK